MGSKDNRGRAKWQDYSGTNAGVAEQNFFKVFNENFISSNYKIREKPNEFNSIYVNVNLSETTLQEIYTPSIVITKHGISPDYAIDNLTTNKTIYIEVKRQDGWVEGKPRAAGRGNAHERSCKYFTPGLLKILRNKGNIKDENALPFWTVFQGDITRDPCRVREISLWFDDYTNHYFFWRNGKDPLPLLEHFNNNLKHLLD
jgi:hypothetical protein